MITLTKAVLAGAALITIAGTASAGGTFETDFTFSASAPPAVTYKSFQDTAQQACRAEMRDIRQMDARTRLERACREQLVAKAIEATRSEVLIAYHKQRIGIPATRRQFAGGPN